MLMPPCVTTRAVTRARAMTPGREWCAAAMVAALLAAGCGGGLIKKQYEYEEDLYPALDGTATLYVNASVAALVALRGAALDVNPRARLDRNAIRSLFQGPGVVVRSPNTSRRNGRRFVHVRVDVQDVRALPAIAPLAWSAYQFDRQKDGLFEFRQTVGKAAGKPVGDVGWTGEEIVAFRLHVPSRIVDNNAPESVERGNILTWEQPLSARMTSAPLELRVRMEAQSILSRTLLLFGSTILAAVLAFAIVIWWLARRGGEGIEEGERLKA